MSMLRPIVIVVGIALLTPACDKKDDSAAGAASGAPGASSAPGSQDHGHDRDHHDWDGGHEGRPH
jgi:hypothetical protein